MERRLLELRVENFRSLRKVVLPLGPLNVLVGPNGAGKTNLLEVFRFLADLIQSDLMPIITLRGGFEEVAFWGGDSVPEYVGIAFTAAWTANSSPVAPDQYRLRVRRTSRGVSRSETFRFGNDDGWNRQIRIQGEKATVTDSAWVDRQSVIGIKAQSSGLSTLPRLSDEEGVAEITTLADHLASFRVFDVRVDAARRPSRFPRGRMASLEYDAGNLAGFLLQLRDADSDGWQNLIDDAKRVLPQLDGIDFEYPSGPGREVIVVLRERGLRRPTQLADASYGTIRLLGLLAMLYDPNPPALTCVEEIDHGLHPQALELLVERLREASERTQFLIATHSPALADRLRPEELIVCERRDDGSSAIPAISRKRIEQIVAESEGLPLGELWFSGALGGDL